MSDDDVVLTRQQVKKFEEDIKEPYKERESERRRSVEVSGGFFEKISALSAGSMAVCASIILGITAKSDIHSGAALKVVHDLIRIADFLGASLLLAILHNFLSAQIAKLDAAISESQFIHTLIAKTASLAQETTPQINDATMAQVEDIVRGQMSPKQSRRVKFKDFLYRCVNWVGYLSILAFGTAFALVLFYLHQLW